MVGAIAPVPVNAVPLNTVPLNTGSLPLGLLGIDPGRVRLERQLALLEELLAGRPPAGAEDIPLDDLRKPVLELDEVDLVLLKLGVGEVVVVVLLLDLPEDVLAVVDH